jgi:hypothetical protein
MGFCTGLDISAGLGSSRPSRLILTQLEEPQRFAIKLLGMADVSDLPLEAR